MNQAKCTTCGAGLTVKQGDKTCVCAYCQSTNIVENALALGKVEVDVTEDIKKLRENLKTFVQQNSIDEILRVSQKLLDWIPQDFVALYFFGYAKQHQNQPRFLYDFYKEAAEHTKEELAMVIDHMMHFSELRDKRRIVDFLTKYSPSSLDRYLEVHEAREDQENHYANVPRDVFVCFSSYNVEIAEQVVKELEADGNSCWISTRNLRPNDAENYWKNIENAIQNASIVLVIGSEDSMLSKDVHQEIDYARQYNKHIIEFKLDDAPHNTLFKHVFNGVKWVKGTLETHQNYVELLQRVYEERYHVSRPVDSYNKNIIAERTELNKGITNDAVHKEKNVSNLSEYELLEDLNAQDHIDFSEELEILTPEEVMTTRFNFLGESNTNHRKTYLPNNKWSLVLLAGLILTFSGVIFESIRSTTWTNIDSDNFINSILTDEINESDIIQHSVVWISYDSIVLESGHLDDGLPIIPPIVLPQREGYLFEVGILNQTTGIS
jgi:uncharacterized Zn finger protein (UPF0148 family)